MSIRGSKQSWLRFISLELSLQNDNCTKLESIRIACRRPFTGLHFHKLYLIVISRYVILLLYHGQSLKNFTHSTALFYTQKTYIHLNAIYLFYSWLWLRLRSVIWLFKIKLKTWNIKDRQNIRETYSYFCWLLIKYGLYCDIL